MTNRRPGLGGLLVLALASAACAGPALPPSTATSTATATATGIVTSPSPGVPTPLPTPERPPDETLDPPPPATLVVGAQRLPGEVGSYVWAGGSDSAPWLPATGLDRAVVPAGARAGVEVDGSQAIESWTATSAAAGDPTASQKRPLGAGTGPPDLELPLGGEWVVAVTVVFAGGLGDATWFWHVSIE